MAVTRTSVPQGHNFRAFCVLYAGFRLTGGVERLSNTYYYLSKCIIVFYDVYLFRYNSELQLSLFTLLKGVPLIVAPLFGDVTVFTVLLVLHSVGKGFVNTGWSTTDI